MSDDTATAADVETDAVASAGTRAADGAGTGGDSEPELVVDTETEPATGAVRGLLAARVRNPWVITGGAVVVALIVGLVVWQIVATSEGGTEDVSRGATATATVETRDLVESEDFDATLGYAREHTVGSPIAGTVRYLADEGTVVAPGGLLVRVDDEAVVVLDGIEPAWRDLDTSTEGADVRQLEENLVALGHADGGDVGPDDDFTSATADAVERLQEALGVEQAGELALGRVVFLAGAQRVASHAVSVGDRVAAGAPVMTVTSVDREVVARVPPEDIDLFAVDAPVSVELPDGTEAPGRVTAIGQSVERDDPQSDESEFQEVDIALDDPAAAGDLVSASVTVSVAKTAAERTLAVPVQALLALAEGGYAVEVVSGDDTTLVAVETGTFADGWVAVTGDVDAGMEVVIPE